MEGRKDMGTDTLVQEFKGRKDHADYIKRGIAVENNFVQDLKELEEISKSIETNENILEVKVLALKILNHSKYLRSRLNKLVKKYEHESNQNRNRSIR